MNLEEPLENLDGAYMIYTREAYENDIKRQQAIARVRELHKPDKYGECKVCIKGWDIYEDIYTYIEYPCDTIKALDGEQ